MMTYRRSSYHYSIIAIILVGTVSIKAHATARKRIQGVRPRTHIMVGGHEVAVQMREIGPYTLPRLDHLETLATDVRGAIGPIRRRAMMLDSISNAYLDPKSTDAPADDVAMPYTAALNGVRAKISVQKVQLERMQQDFVTAFRKVAPDILAIFGDYNAPWDQEGFSHFDKHHLTPTIMGEAQRSPRQAGRVETWRTALRRATTSTARIMALVNTAIRKMDMTHEFDARIHRLADTIQPLEARAIELSRQIEAHRHSLAEMTARIEQELERNGQAKQPSLEKASNGHHAAPPSLKKAFLLIDAIDALSSEAEDLYKKIHRALDEEDLLQKTSSPNIKAEGTLREEASPQNTEPADAFAPTVDELWNFQVDPDDTVDLAEADQQDDAASDQRASRAVVDFKQTWDAFFGGMLFEHTEQLRFSSLETWKRAADAAEKLRLLEDQLMGALQNGANGSAGILSRLGVEHLRAIVDEMAPIEVDAEDIGWAVAELMAMLDVTERDALVGAEAWFSEREEQNDSKKKSVLTPGSSKKLVEGRHGLATAQVLAAKWYSQAARNLNKAIVQWRGFESYWKRNGFDVEPFEAIMERVFAEQALVIGDSNEFYRGMSAAARAIIATDKTSKMQREIASQGGNTDTIWTRIAQSGSDETTGTFDWQAAAGDIGDISILSPDMLTLSGFEHWPDMSEIDSDAFSRRIRVSDNQMIEVDPEQANLSIFHLALFDKLAEIAEGLAQHLGLPLAFDTHIWVPGYNLHQPEKFAELMRTKNRDAMVEVRVRRSDVLAILQHSVHNNLAWLKMHNFNPLDMTVWPTREGLEVAVQLLAQQLAVRHWMNGDRARQSLSGIDLERELTKLGVPAASLVDVYKRGIPLQLFGIASSSTKAADGLAETLENALQDPKNPHRALEITRTIGAPDDMMKNAKIIIDRSGRIPMVTPVY